MVPTWQDLKDFFAHNRWFFGKGEKPQFDRWTYWEKFDYFSVFWGVAIIGLSGLIMWFPEEFTLPSRDGSSTWRCSFTRTRPCLPPGSFSRSTSSTPTSALEKFPMDTVIFSGRISKTEMLHERRRWYDRLVAEGRLEEFG